MKRLTIITLATLLMQFNAAAELSATKPKPVLGHPGGSGLAPDHGDRIVSRPAKFAPVELPREAPDFRAVMPVQKLPVTWTRPTDLVNDTETGLLRQLFTLGSGVFVYLLALTAIFYVRQRRERQNATGPRVVLRRPIPRRGAGRLSIPKP